VTTCTHLDQVPRQASAHVRQSGHPIVTSVEPGEDWSYCHVDDVAFAVPDRPA